MASVVALALALCPASLPAADGRLAGVVGGGTVPELPRADEPFVPGKAIVRFDPGASADARQKARRAAGVAFDSTLGLPRAQMVEVEGSVRAAVRKLERQEGVAYAQPSFRYEATAVPAPEDSFFGELWGLSDPALPDPGVSALEAWEASEGGGRVIAVVDTGVDLTHPDLEPNLWTNTSETEGLPGFDDDFNGAVDDAHGYDFVDDDGNPDEYEFHGTHVAGTAAAVANNEKGIAGVAPQAEIMAVRVLDGDGRGFTPEIAEGIAYAAKNGADAINLSLGGPAFPKEDKLTEDAIEVAASHGAVVVAAAGNEGVDNDSDPHTPCALPQANLICVAALDQNGALAGFSNYGANTVDIAAPGTNVLSARVDYAAPELEDDFESGIGPWTTQEFNGGVAWGTSSSPAIGALSATDSPGGNYGQAKNPALFEGFAISEFFTDAAVDLTAERGCRLHFRAMYQTEDFFDYFAAGAADEGGEGDFAFFTGTSFGYASKAFSREEASISDLDGQNDVHPLFGILSDEEIQQDGAYVDDVRLICRDQTYVDAIASGVEYDQPNAGNYIRFSGTSMATPHVAGVVALVRAAADEAELELSPEQIVDAVLEGASATPNPDPERPTATEGIADACRAIAVATGDNAAVDCPGGSTPTPEGPTGSGNAGTGSLSLEGGVVEGVDATSATGTGAVPSIRPRRALQTFIRHGPRRVIRTRHRRARVVFWFGASERGTTFVCRVDRGRFRRCMRRYARRYSVGRHVLRVVARDAGGRLDRSPAVYRFRVKRRRAR